VNLAFPLAKQPTAWLIYNASSRGRQVQDGDHAGCPLRHVHAKLLDKLSSIGISGRLYQFVQAFLADRRISVRVGASLSDEHILDMGVPQGSVIAPTLFSVMLHDIEAK
ncbi:hypothetical protein BaRGS_00037603, partial [Batillaria attramentaria]